jgi:hypothetical protein
LLRHFRVCLFCMFWGLVVATPSLLVAQKTVTKDAGAGAKEEMDYDARGRVLGSRTIGPDGILQVRITYDYSSSYEVVTKTTNTSYWPDGKLVQKIAQDSYDENNNFTSEIIEDYNQSGKHVSGHQLFHGPTTGSYRCFDWNATQQRHVAIECPESEESHEAPKEIPKLKREEVMQHLATARQAAEAEQKSQHVKPRGSVTTTQKEVGVVVPARLQPGQRVSGRVVDDPDRFAGQPELTVVRVTLPLEPTGDSWWLGGWTFELKGSEPEPAEGPISFVVPSTSGPMEFTLRHASDPALAVSGKFQVSKTPAKVVPIPAGYESPALCFKRDLCVVTGKFNGDSRNTYAAFDNFPATVIAESDTAAYIQVPRFMDLGPATLIVAEGTKVEAMAMVVALVELTHYHEPLEAKQDMITILHVDGVPELSDDQWRYGVFPASNLERARALVPGFNPAKTIEQERERREKQEKLDGIKKKDDKKEESAGMVLVVVNNTNPDVATMRLAKQQAFVFHLAPESFPRGEFKYDIVIDAAKTGTFDLKTTAVPFLAPVKAQEFDAGTTATKK